ncbi:hypothetical protein SS1G_01704 [Sclerotinia sclerotiorum 1980 UF-70]|uniref:C3H1-type domain-containing protein n=2 Tax=Sclerotinia sclerotiorum (strain ATCC 18683 / 1980 / Ss-1) TaxID=665079 RepID=A7E8S6_SCLS1|nr:hypothetical protein SS1G_01704 [Sclerotinia sclerotiorum 1980 UF-70]APA05902.1 hypothetical protein sscle_01g006720 [Sclerotinia sclerotiorum 1980 UF-70]EDN96778.1 hypothetical protein SS1G_01704 [Sclerotinia sclerotiorum 1980 UF-70]
MAGTQQYNFPPPPPPPSGPPAVGYPQQNPQYGYQQPPPYQQTRNNGPPRGGGRGGHSGPPHPHQNGYNGPQGPPQIQGPPSDQYNPHNPAPYIGPPNSSQGPGHNGPPSNYPQQWQQQGQHGPPQHNHGPPQQAHQPPPQVPLQAQNYHPNYAPQGFNQAPPQYGPQQPPPFQQPYGPPSQQPHHGGPPQQWQGPPQGQPQFNNNHRGRGRGGFNNGRGGHEAPLMGPPIRMGFENERGDHMAQAGTGFPTPHYSTHQTPPAPFSQPTYQAYPPQNFPNGGHGGQRPPNDSHSFNSSSNRGRGNGNFRGRGRDNFQFRGRDNNRPFNGNSQSPPMHLKPAGAGDNAKKNKKKRRTNTLGLTPNGVDHEDSDDEIDDVDEEARLVTLLGPDTPQLPADLKAWLAERKNRFPTKARREAAAEELRLKREQNKTNRFKREPETKVVKKDDGETKLEKQQRKAEKLRLELEKAERKIKQEMSGGKRKRENGDEGDEDRGQVSDDDSDSSSSDSGKPDAMSSRNNGHNGIVHARAPPTKAQLQRHCKYYSTGGTCGKKGKCRFVHDLDVRNQALREKELNGGKMTIAQRLILNDTAKDDLTILKSIKYLKEKGLMPESSSVSAPPAEETEPKTEENDYTDAPEYGEV